MLAIGSRPDVLAWRQMVGVFRAYDNPERVIKVGTAGMSDTGMIVAVTITADMVGKTVGVAVCPEFKTATGKQKEKQQNWQRAVEAVGGIYRLIRSPAELVKLVEDVRRGIW